MMDRKRKNEKERVELDLGIFKQSRHLILGLTL